MRGEWTRSRSRSFTEALKTRMPAVTAVAAAGHDWTATMPGEAVEADVQMVSKGGVEKEGALVEENSALFQVFDGVEIVFRGDRQKQNGPSEDGAERKREFHIRLGTRTHRFLRIVI